MSSKVKRGPKATAASMVLELLKKRNAVDEKSAVSIDAFKDIKLTTASLGYTIANLVEEGVVGMTEDERYYYDDLGYKALETKFVRGYAMIFIVPVLAVLLLIALQHFM